MNLGIYLISTNYCQPKEVFEWCKSHLMRQTNLQALHKPHQNKKDQPSFLQHPLQGYILQHLEDCKVTLPNPRD